MHTLHVLVTAIVLLVPFSASGFQGGPDGFGYYWESTQDPGDTITFSWLDPAGHAPLTGWYPNADDGFVRLGLPFRFPFYGDSLDTLVVCSNGFVQYPCSFTAYENDSLPCPRFPSLIALFWDDLNPGASGSVRRFTDPGGQYIVLTWLDVVRYDGEDTVSCQLVIRRDGSLRMNYLRAPTESASATIGIQGNSGNAGNALQYLFDGTPDCHIVRDSTSIRWYFRRLAHDVGVLRPVTPVGWIPASAQVPVIARFRNCGLEPATFDVRATIGRTRTPFDTVFTMTRTITGLAPGDSAESWFGDWLTPPNADSWYVILRTTMAGDMQPANDTARAVTTSVPPRFGQGLAEWQFPWLGGGMNLAGICYRPDTNRFYLAVLDPTRIYSFAHGSVPELAEAAFDLQSFYGDDVAWGIAWLDEPEGFWLGHTADHGAGTILARYDRSGAFTGDTWDISAVEPGAWFAGLAPAPDGTLYAVAVGGQNRIHQLDVAGRRIVRSFGSPTGSLRACGYVGDQDLYIVSGGWNQDALLKLGPWGATLDSVPCPDLADVAVYRPASPPTDSLVWAWATASDQANTLRLLSLGATWGRIGIGEEGLPRGITSGPRVFPNPVGPGRLLALTGVPAGGTVELWDAAGRLVRRFALAPREKPTFRAVDADGSPLPAGVYLLTLSGPAANLTGKLVVLGR